MLSVGEQPQQQFKIDTLSFKEAIKVNYVQAAYVPEFSHGLEIHSLSSVWHHSPVKPGIQAQE